MNTVLIKLSLAGIMLTIGGSEATDTVADAKREYYERVTTCLELEYERYDRTLHRLEASAVRRGDLDAALEVRDERNRVAGQWNAYLQVTPIDPAPDVTKFIWDWSAAEVTLRFQSDGTIWSSHDPSKPNWMGFRQDGDVLLWKHSNTRMWLYRWDGINQKWISRQGDDRTLIVNGPAP